MSIMTQLSLIPCRFLPVQFLFGQYMTTILKSFDLFRSKLESFTELGAFFVLMAKIKFSILYQMLMHTDHENLVEKEATFEIFWVSNRRYEMKRTLQY